MLSGLLTLTKFLLHLEETASKLNLCTLISIAEMGKHSKMS